MWFLNIANPLELNKYPPKNRLKQYLQSQSGLYCNEINITMSKTHKKNVHDILH